MKQNDILKVVAAVNVYGLPIYGKKYSNIDTGKNNLASILKQFSVSKITKIVQLLKREGLFTTEKSDNGKFFSMPSDRTTQKFFLELTLNISTN